MKLTVTNDGRNVRMVAMLAASLELGQIELDAIEDVIDEAIDSLCECAGGREGCEVTLELDFDVFGLSVKSFGGSELCVHAVYSLATRQTTFYANDGSVEEVRENALKV